MRVTARWEFFDAPPTHCSNCGTKLVPFLPDCRRCGTPAPARTGEVEVPESGALEKPTGAIRVAHLSDLHIGQNVPATKLKPIAVFRIWLDRLLELEADVLVISGDIVERPGDDYGMARAHDLLRTSGLDWMTVPGNHDIKRPGYHDVFFDIFGNYPRVETHHGIDFVLFDSMAGLPLEERDVAERMYGDYVCYTEGRVGASQRDRALELLDSTSTRPRAMVLHHHITRQHADPMPGIPKQAGVTEDIFGTMKSLMDADELMVWAYENKLQTIYHGHKHIYQQPGMRPGNILILNAGSSTLRQGNQLGRLIDYLPDRRVVSNLELML